MKTTPLFLITSLWLLLGGCGATSSDGVSSRATAHLGSLSSSASSTIASAASSASVSTSRFPNYNINPQAPDNSQMTRTAVDIASKIRLGWNIGNTLEAIGGETNWGNPQVTQQLIKLVKANGFDAIRIPTSWDQYANQDSAKISDVWLKRVREVVQYCIDEDMYVIVNIHWDGGWLENNLIPANQQALADKQTAFWQQIATQLRDFDDRLLFASANEPEVKLAENMPVLQHLHQTFINSVRATGGRNAYRTLVVQGPITDIETTHQLWQRMPTDTLSNRLMAELHFYTPYNFTLMRKDESWGNQFYYWGSGFHSTTDTGRNPTWGEESHVDYLFDLAKEQFVDQGIPVILGEFAAMRRDDLTGAKRDLHLASRAYYLKYVTQSALARGILPFYWDSGGIDNFGSGLFDRWKNEVFDSNGLTALREGAGK